MIVPDLTCEEALDRLVPLEDGELGPSEVLLVERHLEGCAACAARAEALARVDRAPPFRPNPALEAALFAQLDASLDQAWEEQSPATADAARPRTRARFVGVAMWAAAAILAFSAGYFADAWRPDTFAARAVAVDPVAREAYLPASWDSTASERPALADDGPATPAEP
jgi:anti-sigma factor RsiW